MIYDGIGIGIASFAFLPNLKHYCHLLLLLLPFYIHYTGQPVLAELAGIPVKSCRTLLEQFYCPRALADSN